MEWNLAVALVFAASHFGPREAAGAHHPDSFNTQLHRAHDRLAHSPLVRDPLLDLLCNGLGDELRVDIGMPNLLDIHVHRLAGQLLQLVADVVDPFTASAD